MTANADPACAFPMSMCCPVRPSPYAGADAVGVVMTGMGADGARGRFELKAAGEVAITPNEDTSVVFGMPKGPLRSTQP